MVTLKINFKASRIKDLLNQECINSGYLSDQYSIAFNPNSCGILVYKLVTLKDKRILVLRFYEVSLVFFEKVKIIFYVTFSFQLTFSI